MFIFFLHPPWQNSFLHLKCINLKNIHRLSITMEASCHLTCNIAFLLLHLPWLSTWYRTTPVRILTWLFYPRISETQSLHYDTQRKEKSNFAEETKFFNYFFCNRNLMFSHAWSLAFNGYTCGERGRCENISSSWSCDGNQAVLRGYG